MTPSFFFKKNEFDNKRSELLVYCQGNMLHRINNNELSFIISFFISVSLIYYHINLFLTARLNVFRFLDSITRLTVGQNGIV